MTPGAQTFREQVESGELVMPEFTARIEELEALVAQLERELRDWRSAHGSVVMAKRQLSAKYGRIMRWTPAAKYRRYRRKLRRLFR